MVFLALAFWILSQGNPAGASDVGVNEQGMELQQQPAAYITTVDEQGLDQRNGGEAGDTLDFSNASPDRSPAVLPPDDAETFNRSGMYLDGSSEPMSGGDYSPLDSGSERVPNVVDDQR